MKYINADKLKESIKQLGIKHGICYVMVLGLIDELSEEREDENKFTLDDIVEFVEWVNLHYRALEHTKSIKNVKDTNELFKLWLFKDERKPIVVNSSDIANPLKVAIKGDGTEEYSKAIFQYFGKHTIKGQHDIGSFVCEVYYYIENDNIVFCPFLPKGYTEISLKEDKPTGLILDLVEEIEKQSNRWYDKFQKQKINYREAIERVEELETDNAALCKELTELKLKLKDLSK